MKPDRLITDANFINEIVQTLWEKVRAYYIFPDVAERICLNLKKHLAAGDYEDLIDAEFLAYALTIHLQEVNHDEHLWVKWHPQPLPDGDDTLRHNQGWVAEQQLGSRLDNHGFYKVERLPGNVGYMDIRHFCRPAWGGDTAVAAMSFLANTDALIIDLCHCTGGYPGMVTLISSYLFGDDPVHLNSIYWRDDDITQAYWTLPYVPGKRSENKSVYVLISKATFSAGEAFAYNLQALRRATVVGEQTDGGAHPGASYRLHPHFEVFIPIGRAINPVSNENWEDSGVIPDIRVPKEQAFKTAYKLALMAVMENHRESASGPAKALYQEAQAALEKVDTT